MHSRLNTNSEAKGSGGQAFRHQLRSSRRTASRYAKSALPTRARNRRNRGLGAGVHSEPGVSLRKAGFETQKGASRLSRDAEIIEGQVQSLSADQLLERYHELADQRLSGGIRFRESFELDRIEARLNAENEGEFDRLRILGDDWQRERNALVTSIESLLTRFRAAP